MTIIDLRSDTVTKPTAAMRRAMADAEVGDDVYGEDPTVRRLEERAAETLGKPAALFVPTGTMGNTIAIKLLTRHGEEVICDSRCHVLDWELAMTAWFSGCFARAIETPDGILRWSAIEPQIHSGTFYAPTAVVTIENTHNMHGGAVYPQQVIDEICGNAHARGVRVHLDGARIFNAAAASGTPVARIARDADTVMFCLSKGLCAPAGSMVAASAEAIAEARQLRKRLGGGMRQAGVLAAAGLIALEEMPKRLHEDHDNARRIAKILSGNAELGVDPSKVATNIVVFDAARVGMKVADVQARAKARGVLINTAGGTRLRALTHNDVTRRQCEDAARILLSVFEERT